MNVKCIVETFYYSLLGYGVCSKRGRDRSIGSPSPLDGIFFYQLQARLPSIAGIMRAKSLSKNTTK